MANTRWYEFKEEVYRIFDDDMKKSVNPDLFFNWQTNRKMDIPTFNIYASERLDNSGSDWAYVTITRPKNSDLESDISSGGGAASDQYLIQRQFILSVRVIRDIRTLSGDCEIDIIDLAGDANDKAIEDITRTFDSSIDSLCDLGFFNVDYVRSVEVEEGDDSGSIFYPYRLDIYYNVNYYRQRSY